MCVCVEQETNARIGKVFQKLKYSLMNETKLATFVSPAIDLLFQLFRSSWYVTCLFSAPSI